MSIVSNQDLLKALYWRYATKKFDPTHNISKEDWQTLEEALILTPSSYGLQPWKFFVITSKAIRQELTLFSWNQSQVLNCSHYVVFTIKKHFKTSDIDAYLDQVVHFRKVSKESLSGYRQAMINDVIEGRRSFSINEWATRQTYIALGNFMTCAALRGIDTCPMEGIDPENYDRILKLNGRDLTSVVACAAGYRSIEDKYALLPKVRFPKSKVIENLD